MTTLLDLLDLIGRTTWEPVWVPVLAWTALALPLYLVLTRTHHRLHPLAEYRLSQVLMAALPVGLFAVALVDLLPGSPAVAPGGRFSVTVLPAVEARSAAPSASSPWQWTHAVGLLTIVAGGVALLRLSKLTLDVVAAIRVRRSLDGSAPSSIQSRAARIARRLGTTRPVQVCVTSDAVVPVTLGGRRPTILLPPDLAEDPAALRMTLVHESVHVRRYDDLAHLLERLVAGLFGAHPLVGRLQQHVARTREHACDAVVLNDDQNAPADYARLLLAFANGPRPQNLDALSLSESPSALTNRLRTMRSSVSHWLSSPFRLASALTVVGLFLTLGMVACSDSVTPPASDPSSEESSEAPAEKDVFTEAENQPDCGGIRALSQNIQYPETAKAAGIEGRVFVEFVVDEAGNVTEPNIRKGAHKTLDETALAAVKQLQCEPGTVQGEPVKVQMTLPVTFKLPDDSSSKPSEEMSSASAGLDEIVFHNLSEPQQDRILSGPTFSKETRSALNSDLSYPELIRRAGVEGTVKVTFTLGESGTPIRPRVTKSLHDALDAMALRSVQNTTFTTAETETVDLSGTKMSVRFAYRLPDRSS